MARQFNATARPPYEFLPRPSPIPVSRAEIRDERPLPGRWPDRQPADSPVLSSTRASTSGPGCRTAPDRASHPGTPNDDSPRPRPKADGPGLKDKSSRHSRSSLEAGTSLPRPAKGLSLPKYTHHIPKSIEDCQKREMASEMEMRRK